MVGNYSIECCIGIRHTECIDILFDYLSKEDCIDKINILISIPKVLDQVKQSVLKHTSIHDKISFSIFGAIDNCDEIRKKYKNNNTIYLYLDDDICYLSPQSISKLSKWHIESKNIISYPSIANTGSTTFIWQIMGILPIFKSKDSKIEDTDYYWVDCAKLPSQNIITIHKNIIEAIESKRDLSFYKYHLYRLHEACNQCYMWEGGENCQTPYNILFEKYPEKFCINAEILASHYAFNTHLSDLNKTNILEKYSKLC